METTSRPTAPAADRHPPSGWKRVTGVLVLGLLSVVLLGAGAYAAWVRSSGTYVDLGANGTYQTDRYALVTDDTNWSTTLLGWAGSVQLELAPAKGEPIFVGVAAPDAVGHYLEETGYTTIATKSGNRVTHTDHDGAAPTAPPRNAVAWTAHAEGAGLQTLRWHATDGRQVATAMNADQSRAVRVRVVSSSVTLDRMPWWVPSTLLALGLVLLLPGIALVRRAVRARG
jgi:hypothetical protein